LLGFLSGHTPVELHDCGAFLEGFLRIVFREVVYACQNRGNWDIRDTFAMGVGLRAVFLPRFERETGSGNTCNRGSWHGLPAVSARRADRLPRFLPRLATCLDHDRGSTELLLARLRPICPGCPGSGR